MTMDKRIREAVDITAFSSRDIEEYKNFADKEMLTPQQNRIIKQSKLTYFPLGKVSEKQVKTIEELRGKKEIQILQTLIR